MKKKYRYSEEDLIRIKAARKRNKDKRAEKRLYALELRGKSAEEASAATGFHKEVIATSKELRAYPQMIRTQLADFASYFVDFPWRATARLRKIASSDTKSDGAICARLILG